VGGQNAVRVDVRVIAATNKDLAAEIRQGRFREDLYFRLNVIPIAVPPLRARAGDTIRLAEHFVAEFAREYGRRPKSFSPEAQNLLEAYHWPGNVRELKNSIEALRILAPGPEIGLDDLPPNVRERRPVRGNAWAARPIVELGQVIDEYILYALERCGGNKSQAARLLAIDPKTLYKRLRRP